MTVEKNRIEPHRAPRRLKTILIEDSDIVRVRVVALLEPMASVEFLGSAKDGTQGLAMFRAQRPDVVVLDLDLPGIGGLDLIPIFKREQADSLVIVFTNHAEEVFREQCLHRGADYFFNKSTEFERMIEVLPPLSATSS